MVPQALSIRGWNNGCRLPEQDLATVPPPLVLAALSSLGLCPLLPEELTCLPAWALPFRAALPQSRCHPLLTSPAQLLATHNSVTTHASRSLNTGLCTHPGPSSQPPPHTLQMLTCSPREVGPKWYGGDRCPHEAFLWDQPPSAPAPAARRVWDQVEPGFQERRSFAQLTLVHQGLERGDAEALGML